MYLAPQMRLAALGQQGQTLLPRQKRDRSSDFKNVTPERMQKAEEERRRYLERNNGVDKHNLADDIYNFMATEPGDIGHRTTGLPQLSQDIMPKAIQFSNGRPMSGTGQPTPPDPSSIRLGRGDGGTLPPGYYQEPPRRPGGMENLSGSLGGQIRPNPYSAPPQMGGGFGGQMGSGFGGGQGMQQFMQFMQTMMQMFQQLQGGGMSGGFQRQMRPRPQTYGRSPYGGY